MINEWSSFHNSRKSWNICCHFTIVIITYSNAFCNHPSNNFSCEFGLFEFSEVLNGLYNAPTLFQQHQNQIFDNVSLSKSY
jgi:hypothetical protein